MVKDGKKAVIVAGAGVVIAGVVLLLKKKLPPEEPTVFTCPFCDAEFATVAELLAHIESEHPEAPPAVFTCPFCDAEFATVAELLVHIVNLHPEAVFTCPFCDAEFVTVAELLAHIASEHPEEPPVFTCPYCGAEFATEAELLAHIASEHPEKPPVFICPHCGAAFATQAELNAHIASEHPPVGEFAWLRPTGHIPGRWNDEQLAYDGWTDSRAEVTGVGTQSWSPYLELTIEPTLISAVRWWGSSPITPKKIQVDVHYAGGSYHNIYDGAAVKMWPNSLAIPDGPQIIDGVRIRFYNNARTMSMKFRVNEFEFYGEGEAPPPPEPPPTTNLRGYVTNKNTGAPVAGAGGTVYQDKGTDTWKHNFITNADGYYEIMDMIDDADQNLMVIYADGYQTYTNEHVTINEGENLLNIQMTPGG